MAEESSGKGDSSSEDTTPRYLHFPDEDQAEEMDHGERIRTIISFFGVGLIMHGLFSIVISGSQDILGGTYIPTTAVIIAHVGPMVVVVYTFPWFMQKMSYFIRILAVFAFMATGFVVISFVENPYIKITGVSLNAVAHALGEITFLALGAFYGDISVTSFAAGSGAGILIGPVYYLGLTSWACVSPQETMIFASAGSLLVLVCYYILNKDRIKSHAIAATYTSTKYSVVPLNKDGDPVQLGWSEKLSAALKISPFMISLCMAYIMQYLTIHAVFTTMSFPNSPFHPRDHYVYYVAVNGLGELISRSYLGILFCVKPQVAVKIAINKTWILSLMLTGVFALAVCASWFRFIDNAIVVLFMSFVVGCLSGSVYSNTLVSVRESVEPRYQEFCLGIVTAGSNSGALIGSFIGLWLEPILRTHCQHLVSKGASYCFTRHQKRIWTQAICHGKPVKIKIQI